MRIQLKIPKDIYDYIEKNNGCSYSEIVKNLHLDKRTVSFHLRNLKKDCKVIQINNLYYFIPIKKRDDLKLGYLTITLKIKNDY